MLAQMTDERLVHLWERAADTYETVLPTSAR
jgi:hypothetical protein